MGTFSGFSVVELFLEMCFYEFYYFSIKFLVGEY